MCFVFKLFSCGQGSDPFFVLRKGFRQMTATQQESWVEYYRELYAAGTAWLDYSNPRVQGQTFGIAIEAAGPLGGKRCMDIGCGRGQLALSVAAFQASEVVGVDIMADSIASLRERHPHVTWK